MRPPSNDARRRALLAKIQTEGAEAAYQAALEVCLDKKAPAPARATCSTTLLRASGFLNAKPIDVAPKEAHEMSYDELQSAIDELGLLSASLKARAIGDDDPDEGPDDLGVLG